MEKVKEIIPAEYAIQHSVFPINEGKNLIKIAVTDPPDSNLLREMEFLYEKKIIPVLWDEIKIKEAILQKYGIVDISDRDNFIFKEKYADVTQDHEPPGEDGSSTINWLNHLLSFAITRNASDIHIESYDHTTRVRLRIDGKMMEYNNPVNSRKQAIISRLKIVANMDIAEKRRPQDGRIQMTNSHRNVDIRVSTMPTDFGEKIVLRILDKSSLNLSLNALGFDPQVLSIFEKILNLSHGLILVTGPTGSGKTTTLYSALNFLNKVNVNIQTIEDPIEYSLTGINQTQVNPQIDLSFANLLRTVLRQDPDIIMVGEIRDSETARIAVQAALTGHLVLSTIHTNDAASTIIRLIEIGIEPFLVASALKLVLAQRLVRKICPNCRIEEHRTAGYFKEHQLPEELNKYTFYTGPGCRECQGIGYAGREAIVEYVAVNDEFAELISRAPQVYELRSLANSRGLSSLQEAGLRKCLAGITSLDEIIYHSL